MQGKVSLQKKEDYESLFSLSLFGVWVRWKCVLHNQQEKNGDGFAYRILLIHDVYLKSNKISSWFLSGVYFVVWSKKLQQTIGQAFQILMLLQFFQTISEVIYT